MLKISHFCIIFSLLYKKASGKIYPKGVVMKLDSVKKMVVVVCGLIAFSAVQASADDSENERYPFGVTPNKMMGITMKDGDKLHDLHVAKLEAMGKDCTVCHINDDYESFMGLNAVQGQDEKMAYLHENCTSCHVEMGGPRITSCRSCHNVAYKAN